MKKFSHSVNINNGDNRVISHTESDWKAMRPNSLITIGGDSQFFSIQKIEKINFISDFEVDGNFLKIQGLHDLLFLDDDIIIISYKEYSLSFIKSFLNKGENYKLGDIVSFSTGEASLDIVNNYKKYAKLKVEEVDGNGGITKLQILELGEYIIIPNNGVLVGGHGQNAQIDFEFKTSLNRKMITSQVLNVDTTPTHTLIEISNELPSSITSGKISMSKYIGYLDKNYIGNNHRNIEYNINRDQTPFLQLPLMVANSNKKEELFNYCLLELDKKIRELSNKLDKLS